MSLSESQILTFNAGSSSIKFALFAPAVDGVNLLANGQIDGLGSAPRFQAKVGDCAKISRELSAANHIDATHSIVAWLRETFLQTTITAIGHRIVHGGTHYSEPMPIDVELLKNLESFIPLAPLHQPHNIAGVKAAQKAFPNVCQVACFDTAFHRGHSFVNEAYALPRKYYDHGVRRFGFHGLSYEYIARRLQTVDPMHAKGRVIVAHLGNGASLCAMKDGKSIASTMGFSALEGLPMGTRCGAIDPGLLLYLLEHEQLSVRELGSLLYRQSGLLGLSDLSNDMRMLEASDKPEAKQAVDFFIHSVSMNIASMAATIGGVDLIVFTGGIGENSATIRAGVIKELSWLGVSLSSEANDCREEKISDAASAITVYRLSTDEEIMIALHTMTVAGLSAELGV